MRLAAVILAAGKGTRMKSALPKVLHKVGGKPMLGHVLDAVVRAGVQKKVVVAGYGGEEVKSYVGDLAQVVYQEQQLGTAHALLQAKDLFTDFSGHLLVVCGDTPLITSDTLSMLVREHIDNKAAATVLTAFVDDPTGYGRIIRNDYGGLSRIVEQKDASAEELQVKEINTGVYCFALSGLFETLQQIRPANAQGEYYLTDIIEIYNRRNLKVAVCSGADINEVMGVNNRRQLAAVGKVLRDRVLNRLMDEGVTVIDPQSTYVDSTVIIEPDAVLYPGSIIEGSTKIASQAVIGPNTRIVDSTVAQGCQIQYSVVLNSEIGSGCSVGPYAYIRPGTKLGADVKIGDFVEVKNSVVGKKSKIPHLSYIGDAVIGVGVNVGAGTITCNYDGVNKHITEIEDAAFIGSNTNLVAPVKVGSGAVIGAGSTITKDVPQGALGLARGKQVNKEGWARKKGK
ncbi:bifunctional UDP-N-acetylglucosamine diphosphorylase/glucosamine-1-phosphate N-acetyltransferase GlmU [Desulfofalx alkaliphila]|uniref:bifunctional UDP-N-acetylglucosamine diphosphorylase/glucosamine-1-phosphate N-acetyltransferase GlmU n=1 Tax=Desulfofalx alkaliphila TaxID=105483 RepID=UPI0004E2182A|nr:bifunctional UDP-N-acetylglucosamine diphosphorylase/glucosamine-1-phosphate N-acetyltransferase GlmU [Desulfofalx alkaliphila]